MNPASTCNGRINNEFQIKRKMEAHITHCTQMPCRPRIDQWWVLYSSYMSLMLLTQVTCTKSGSSYARKDNCEWCCKRFSKERRLI